MGDADRGLLECGAEPFLGGVQCRFDLAPPNGQTCGQYRIVFGKGVGQAPLTTAGNQDVFNRNLIIFEAVLPNPQPSKGLLGCGPVMEYWQSLSSLADPGQRAAKLDQFFFTGVAGFEPGVKFLVDAHELPGALLRAGDRILGD